MVDGSVAFPNFVLQDRFPKYTAASSGRGSPFHSLSVTLELLLTPAIPLLPTRFSLNCPNQFMNFVAAVCPQCAGKLQVPDDRDVVKCMYCGVDVVVRQAVRLLPGNTANLLELADSALTAGNHAEAIDYYNKVLENEPKSVRAWAGKGIAAGWKSTLADFRFQEMLVAFENAAKYADVETKHQVLEDAASTINQVAIACHQISRKHALEYIALDNTWLEYLSRCKMITSALQVAHGYHPEDQATIKNVIHLCIDNIDGVAYNDPYDNNIRKTVRLSDSYEIEIRSLMGTFLGKMKALNPAYELPEATRPSTGCFVVTATFDDENHPHVRLLRAFRDEILERSTFGAVICRVYYSHGPILAKAIGNSAVLRAISRRVVVAPAVLIARQILVSQREAPHRRGGA
jgi:tetratricopeptide (TPR) repeat protein